MVEKYEVIISWIYRHIVVDGEKVEWVATVTLLNFYLINSKMLTNFPRLTKGYDIRPRYGHYDF